MHYEIIGETVDDAAGEAFDKIGRLLSLPYPGGPYIEQAAKKGDSKRFNFPSPLIGSDDFDFSFSGLKTAVLREVISLKNINEQTKADICFSVQKAIIDVLVKKTLTAAKKFDAKSILLGGGVAANRSLREQFQLEVSSQKLALKLFAPPKSLCTDNAAMIATAAFFNNDIKDWQKLDADPALYFNTLN